MKRTPRYGILLCVGVALFMALGLSRPRSSGDSPTPSPVATAQGTYDVTITGAVSGESKSGANDGSGMSCSIVEDGRLVIGLYGDIFGTTYGFALTQTPFENGSFAYPGSPPPSGFASSVPVLQLSPRGQSLNWTADSAGNGGGTSEIGGQGRDIIVHLDADLSPNGPGLPVHVLGDIHCSS